MKDDILQYNTLRNYKLSANRKYDNTLKYKKGLVIQIWRQKIGQTSLCFDILICEIKLSVQIC